MAALDSCFSSIVPIERNLFYMNSVRLRVKGSREFYFLAFKAEHQIRPVDGVNIFPRCEHEIAAMPDAVRDARVRSALQGFRLEHLIMRLREYRSIVGALTVGNFSLKHARILGESGIRQSPTNCHDADATSFHSHARDRYNTQSI
jgi:hypothetical protein